MKWRNQRPSEETSEFSTKVYRFTLDSKFMQILFKLRSQPCWSSSSCTSEWDFLDIYDLVLTFLARLRWTCRRMKCKLNLKFELTSKLSQWNILNSLDVDTKASRKFQSQLKTTFISLGLQKSSSSSRNARLLNIYHTRTCMLCCNRHHLEWLLG